MVLPIAALIGAAASIGGSLFDASQRNRAAKKARRQARQSSLKRLVKDAEAAGISPLAALGSPMAGNYGLAQSPIPSSPVSGSVIGDAIGGIARESFPSDVEKMTNENMALRNAALRAEIRRTNADTARLLGEAQSRTAIAAAYADTRGSELTSVLPAQSSVHAKKGERGSTTMFKLPDILGGATLRSSGGTGQAFEDFIGEGPLSWPYGGVRLGEAGARLVLERLGDLLDFRPTANRRIR